MCECDTYFVVDYTTGDSICTECGIVINRDFSQQINHYDCIQWNVSNNTEDLSSKEPTTLECKASLMYNRMYTNWPEIVGTHSKVIVIDIIQSLLDGTSRKNTSLYKKIRSMFMNLRHHLNK